MKKVIFFSALTALAAVGLSGCGSKPVIDFEECVSVTFTGYDNEGTGYIQTDNGYIFSMLGDMNSLSAAALVSTFTIDGIENNGELSNGDVITLTVNTDAEALKNAKVKVTNTELEFVVTGLEQKPVIDVFEDVTLTVKGTSPKCSVSAMYGDTNYLIGGYNFEITSADGKEKDYYQNGDTVTVTLTEDTRQKIEKDYILKEISRDYVVQADSKYIMSAADVSGKESDLENLATDFTDNALSNTRAARVKVLSGISGVGEGTLYANSYSLTIDNVTFNSAYVGTSSTKSILGDVTYTPCIYFFYNADFTYKTSSRAEEKMASGIIAVKMDNPKISKDGKITYEKISVSSSSTDFDYYKSITESFEKLY